MPDNPDLQKALAQLAATPSRLAHLTVESTDEDLDAGPEGEWSARVVLAHLRDAEMVEFRVGLERLVAEPNPALYFLPRTSGSASATASATTRACCWGTSRCSGRRR